MITFETCLFGLLIISTLTGLATEAVKKILTEHNVEYHANTLAGIVAFVLSLALGTGYVILSDLDFTTKVVVCIIAETFMSWLCAMVGYDKVIQTISQFKTPKEN